MWPLLAVLNGTVVAVYAAALNSDYFSSCHGYGENLAMMHAH
jgi:hypothetical protein